MISPNHERKLLMMIDSASEASELTMNLFRDIIAQRQNGVTVLCFLLRSLRK